MKLKWENTASNYYCARIGKIKIEVYGRNLHWSLEIDTNPVNAMARAGFINGFKSRRAANAMIPKLLELLGVKIDE